MAESAAVPPQAIFYEAFAEEACELRQALAAKAGTPGVPREDEVVFTPATIQEAGHRLPPAPVISIRTQSRIPVAWASRLGGIITRSTGYDHVAAYLDEAGVAVPAAYLPEYAARAVAEQAMLLWIALLRHLPRQQRAFAEFARDGLTGRELRGRHLTVVGVGRIGGEIVALGHALGMDVVGVDLVERPELVAAHGLRYLPLPEAVARAEVLVAALPLTGLTRGMLGYERLRHLPPGAVLVNVGRGEVAPSVDLLRLLDAGVLAGVGLDVYDHEPELAAVLRAGVDPASLPADARASVAAILRLADDPRAILLPHNAFNSAEAVVRKSHETVDNLCRFLATGTFLTPLP
jgi:D-lactate dehydrogenase